MRACKTIVVVVWALPWTLFGLLLGGLGLATGGSVRRTGRVLEFWGGWVATFLRLFPLVSGVSAVTFGHTVLGRSQDALDACQAHEMVHVRQYEHWGPLFVPAYLFHWVRLRLARRDPYFDNPFERQARDETEGSFPGQFE
jgi:hypothetical protein